MKYHFHPVRVASAKIGCRPLLLLRLSHSHPHQPPLWPQRFIAKLWRRRSYNLLGRESYYSLAACSAGEKCLKRPWSAGEGTKRFPQGLKIRRKFDTVGNVRRESVLKGHVHVTCPKCLVFWTPPPCHYQTHATSPPSFWSDFGYHQGLLPRSRNHMYMPLKWIYCCLGTIHSFLVAHANSVMFFIPTWLVIQNSQLCLILSMHPSSASDSQYTTTASWLDVQSDAVMSWEAREPENFYSGSRLEE